MSVSVLIPTFNCAGTIRSSLLSVLRQLDGESKIIIIDDSSEDDTLKVVSDLNKGNIQLIKNSGKRLGVAESLNEGIRCVRSKYIARLDGDDIFIPMHLKNSFSFYKRRGDAAIVGAQMIAFPKLRPRFFPVAPEKIRKSIFVDNPMAHPTVFGSSEIFKKYMYTNLRHCEDLDLWFRILADGHSLRNSMHFGTLYRTHANQQTKDPLAAEYADKIRKQFESMR